MPCRFDIASFGRLTAWGRVHRLWQRFGILIALVLIGATLTVRTPAFLTTANLINVARQISINGILAVGVTFVLLTGGVDLSLGSVVAFAGVVAASFAHPDRYPVMVPVAIGILAGTACGATNGLVVTRGGVAPFIATLGMMTVAARARAVVSGGKPVSNMSPEIDPDGRRFSRHPGADVDASRPCRWLPG